MAKETEMMPFCQYPILCKFCPYTNSPYDDAVRFGIFLQRAFDLASKGTPFLEVKLFRSLMTAFDNLGPGFHIEEYHGTKHIVSFKGKQRWSSHPDRCELCDLVILSYSKENGFDARITFLQAKRSKEIVTVPCPPPAGGLRFSANLVQWDLLSNRPLICLSSSFIPPPPQDLLASAILPSVGSFGVFHQSPHGVNFFYVCADELSPAGAYTQKNGRVRMQTPFPCLQHANGLIETVFSPCLHTFGAALYRLEIGTPITSQPACAPLLKWTQGLVGYHLQHSGKNPRLLSELGEQLNALTEGVTLESTAPEWRGSTPTLLIIKAGEKHDETTQSFHQLPPRE